MHQEKYSLSWQTHSDHLKRMMKELMMNEDFSDVTLVTDDKKEIKANIHVLRTCSPVFKDILKKEKNLNSIIYLRGVQFTEMESIIQFVYLGETTFYKERMAEFFAVAKSLEIEELCNAESETNDEPEDDYQASEPISPTETLEEQTNESECKMEALQERVVVGNGKYECEECSKTYSNRKGLSFHKKSVHQGLRWPCGQCDYQATQQSNLNVHIRSQHEGIKFECDQCDYMASQKHHLIRHNKNKHGGNLL